MVDKKAEIEFFKTDLNLVGLLNDDKVSATKTY
jgi:hypothetical protein